MNQWLCISSGIVVGKWFYFTILNGNGLFKCNIEKESIVYLGKFPNEEKNQNCMYDKISVYKNYLIFWPTQAKKIGVYDLENQKFVIDLCEHIKCNHIGNMIPYKGEYYFFGVYDTPYIYKYNVQFNSEKYIIHDMNSIIGNRRECLIFTHRLDYDNENIYIPVNNADFMLSFHWESEKIEVVELPKIDANYYRLISIDETLYLLDATGRLVCYNKRSKEFRVLFDIKDYNWDWNGTGAAFGEMLRYKECLYLIPYGRNCELVCYNYKAKKIYFGGENLPRGNNEIYRYAEIYGKMLYIFDNNKGTLVQIDLDNYHFREVDCKDTFNIANFYNMNNGCISEDGQICNSLHAYISNMEQYGNQRIKSREIGTKIYRYLGEQI